MIIRNKIKEQSFLNNKRTSWELTESPWYYYYNTETKEEFGCYEEAEDFLDGLAIVLMPEWRKYGVINEKGETVIPDYYDQIIRDSEHKLFICIIKHFDSAFFPIIDIQNYRSYDGSIIVKNGDDWLIVPQDYYAVGTISEGLLRVARISESSLFPDNPAPDDYLWGFINEKGEEVIPCQFMVAHDFSDGLAFVQLEFRGPVCFINKDGKAVLEDVNTDDDFHEGLCRVQVGGFVGFINKTGTITIPAIYTSATNFSDGKSFVSRHPTIGENIIDKTGGLYWKSERGLLALPKKYYWFSKLTKELIVVLLHNDKNVFDLDNQYRGELEGVVNIEMVEVIPCKYRSISIEGGKIKAVQPLSVYDEENERIIDTIDWYSLNSSPILIGSEKVYI